MRLSTYLLSLATVLMVLEIRKGIAQSHVGLRMGASSSGISHFAHNSNYVVKREWGFAGALVLNRQLNNALSIEVAPGVQEFSYSRKRKNPYRSIFHRYENLYLHLPVTVQVSKNYGRFTPFINAGMFISYRIRAIEAGVMPNVFDNDISTVDLRESIRLTAYQANVWKNDGIRNMEAGMQLGVGTRYRINDGWGLSLAIAYLQGLCQRSRSGHWGDHSGYNNATNLQLGLIHFLGR